MICCLNPDCPNPQNADGNKLCQTCSTPLVSLLRNRFRVIQVLSDEGGFGRTYLSEDIDKLNEPCVIKQLAPKFQGTWSQKKAIELFAQEAKRLQELGEHPQIPTLLAYFEQENCLYLVQQLIHGQNLLKELQSKKTYKDWDIQSILLDLLPILKFIHERGIIHRDIKPENVIRRKQDGRLTLIDFGSSKQFTAKGQHKSGTSIGSHGYSPIEQIRDGKAYPASDLFSLGATCFHLLTGISPFKLWMEYGYSWVENWQQYLRCPLSAELSEVLDKMLKKDIQERYQSADEVLRDLTKKHQLLLAPANRNNVNKTLASSPSFPSQYFILRNLLLALAAIISLVLGKTGYQEYLRLQRNVSSQLNPPNHTNNSEAVLVQKPLLDIGKISSVHAIKGNDDEVLSIAISPDSKTLISSGYHTIKLWNLDKGNKISSLEGYSQKINVLSISPNGKILASGNDDGTIKIWNLTTKTEIRTLKGHSDSVHALVISPDNQTLVSGSDDSTIKVWNLASGKQIHTLSHSFWVRALAISPDNSMIASGSFDKTIKLWDLQKGKTIRTFTGNTQTINSVAFSPDGKILASGSRDRTIKLWNLVTGKEIITLPGHTNTVTSVAFSPDGKILASGSRDRTIKLWNLVTGKEIITLPGHTNTITSVLFSQDGKTLVSGSEDDTIRIWRSTP